MTQPWSLAHPGLRRQTTCVQLQPQNPKPFFQPQPAPAEPKGKTSAAKGCQLMAEPPGSWGCGGGALGSPEDFPSPARRRTVPRMPGSSWEICIVLPAGAQQSQQLPARPSSHHPAHSCSQPFGNRTLREGSRKKKRSNQCYPVFPEGRCRL